MENEMNQKELKDLSALVERRLTVRTLLKEWESGELETPPSAEQRQAIRQILAEKSDDYARLEESVTRLADQMDRLEASLGPKSVDAASAARVQKVQRDLEAVGDSVRKLQGTFRPTSLSEVHTAALLDPYGDDSAPLAQRVHVPEGDL